MRCLGTTLIMGLAMISAAPAFAGREVVGVFLKYENNCSVIHEGQPNRCDQGTSLVPGDIIITSGRLESFKIQWIRSRPSTEKVAGNGYRVVNEVREKNGLVDLVPDILVEFNRKASHVVNTEVTRGGEKTMQLPGNNASILFADRPITFSWCGATARRLVVKELGGKEIFEQSVKGKSSLELTPEMMGLKRDNSYTWEVEGGNSSGENLRFLDDESAKVVKEAFNKIDEKQGLKDNDKVIAKASFVQFMSESYPEEIFLNWMCYQLIDKQESKLLKNEQEVAEYLKFRSNLNRCGM